MSSLWPWVLESMFVSVILFLWQNNYIIYLALTWATLRRRKFWCISKLLGPNNLEETWVLWMTWNRNNQPFCIQWLYNTNETRNYSLRQKSWQGYENLPDHSEVWVQLSKHHSTILLLIYDLFPLPQTFHYNCVWIRLLEAQHWIGERKIRDAMQGKTKVLAFPTL